MNVKSDPTAYDLLLAYADITEAYEVSRRDLRFDYLGTVMKKHGASELDTLSPHDYLTRLRRRALDAAKREQGGKA